MSKLHNSIFSVLLLALLAGCAALPPVESGQQITAAPGSPVLDRQSVIIPVGEDEVVQSRDYLVGPGDVLSINTYGLPQLGASSANLAGTAEGYSNGLMQGRVDGAGNIHLPWLGSVAVAGLSVAQIQEKLKEALKLYSKDPWVVVDIVAFKSQPVHLLGQFKQPGTYYMDRSLNLLEGLAQGNGFDEFADLRAARLLRGEKTYPVDIYRLLNHGDPRQNIRLKAGDIIFIPDDKNKQVFVFGAVKKPGMVAMNHGQLSLAQALTVAEFSFAGGNDKHIRIIRSLSPTQGELLVVDLSRIMAGEQLPYPLMEGDIIYVPGTRVGNWNQAIQELIPSLQLVSSILQPFVQLRFLSDN